MKTFILAALSLCLLVQGTSIEQTRKSGLPCLKTVADIRLPGRTSRFDYQSIDRERSFLFIAHLGDNAVTVFDLKSHRVIKNITGIWTPHGILAVPQLGRVFVSATRVNEVYTIDEGTLTVIGKTDAGSFPDGIGFDPGTERIFVSDEFGKTVTVIDARSLKAVRRIEIGGRVGNTHYDPISKTIFTTNETENELYEIDPSTLQIIGRTKMPGCKGAHGFVIGKRPHFAYVTGEDNASLVVIDLSRRKVIQRVGVGNGPDVLAIDSGLNLLYVSSESGVVSVFRIKTDGLSALCKGRLWAHAHTISVDNKTHSVYFPLQDWKGFPTLRIMVPRDLLGHPASRRRE